MAVVRATAIALVLAGIAPATASAARHMEVGVQDDGVLLGHYFNRDKGFDLAERLGATRVRVMVQWAKVSRGRRGYDFAPFDALASAAAARGMKLQVVLTGPAPAFATANHRIGPVRPNARRFAQFAG